MDCDFAALHFVAMAAFHLVARNRSDSLKESRNQSTMGSMRSRLAEAWICHADEANEWNAGAHHDGDDEGDATVSEDEMGAFAVCADPDEMDGMACHVHMDDDGALVHCDDGWAENHSCVHVGGADVGWNDLKGVTEVASVV